MLCFIAKQRQINQTVLHSRGALTFEMDTGVRLALSNPGAFGDSEHAKNKGLWVRGVFTSKFTKNDLC